MTVWSSRGVACCLSHLIPSTNAPVQSVPQTHLAHSPHENASRPRFSSSSSLLVFPSFFSPGNNFSQIHFSKSSNHRPMKISVRRRKTRFNKMRAKNAQMKVNLFVIFPFLNKFSSLWPTIGWPLHAYSNVNGVQCVAHRRDFVQKIIESTYLTEHGPIWQRNYHSRMAFCLPHRNAMRCTECIESDTSWSIRIRKSEMNALRGFSRGRRHSISASACHRRFDHLNFSRFESKKTKWFFRNGDSMLILEMDISTFFSVVEFHRTTHSGSFT